MAQADHRTAGRLTALSVALEATPAPTSEAPFGLLPITAAQWQRSVVDAALDRLASVYSTRRLDVVSALKLGATAVGRRVRPAALQLANAARDLCDCLETLGVLEPDEQAPRAAHAWRDLVAQDARAVIVAAINDVDPPPSCAWPALPAIAVDDRDVLLAVFGIAADDLTDDSGAFCDARVLAHYRLRLEELQQICDPILGLVADRPPSVFTAVSAARDLATSVSPFVTLQSARDIRGRILTAFATDAARTIALLSDAQREMDKEWSSFVRLQDRLRRAEAALTQRDRAVSLLEAYKHMAEGIVRRWVWVLLRVSGLDGSPPTVGALGEPAAARLGELGARLQSALVPAMRNAEAHEDFKFDEDTGLLIVGEVTFHPDEILARLTDLDVLQRALIVGRLAAFADEPALAGDTARSPVGSSASSTMMFARQRFGHAGQRVRSFVRDRDRLDITIDALRSEVCNPCFLALTQAAQALPNVSRFVVRIPGYENPIIDVPATVLHSNWPVLELAVRHFPDALPQVTFLPCLTWVRLAIEPMEEATRAAAWMALNEAQHAILDAEAARLELLRLPDRLRLVAAAITATLRLLPQGSDVGALLRARRLACANANALLDGGGTIAANVLMDGILRSRDRLGGPPPVMPTLDPSRPGERVYPHETA